MKFIFLVYNINTMKQLNLKKEDIYNKEFNVDMKGFNTDEVDNFLDLIIQDYETFEDKTQALLNEISRLHNEIESLKKENNELKSNNKVIDLNNTTTYGNVDLLKRVSRLEQMVFKK